MKKTLRSTAVAFASFGLASLTSHAAPLVFNTVADYDSTTNANVVDRTAIGNLPTFKTDLLTAFSNNLGGVINFDNTGTFNSQTEGISAKYGTGLGKTLSITTSATFNIQFSNNIRAISGNENSGTGLFLLDPTAGNQFYTITLGPLTGGLPGEVVTSVGFTILARNGGGAPTISATATYNDSTTSVASAPFTVTSTIPSMTEDTFFGFTAPAGKSIASITLNYGAGGVDLRRGIDDFAFITTAPASGSAFDTWATGKGLDGTPGKEKGFGDDPDADGIKNGLEWILGGNPLSGLNAALLPVGVESESNFTFTYFREDLSKSDTTQIVEYGTSLDSWTDVVVTAASSGPDVNGVSVAITPNDALPDTVTVTIPKTNAPQGRLFARLKATLP